MKKKKTDVNFFVHVSLQGKKGKSRRCDDDKKSIRSADHRPYTHFFIYKKSFAVAVRTGQGYKIII
jgi:hypothetical protein